MTIVNYDDHERVAFYLWPLPSTRSLFRCGLTDDDMAGGALDACIASMGPTITQL